ncbi:MAG: hypothetical protein DI592_10655, partial [Stenotrophomonas maltophilia]
MLYFDPAARRGFCLCAQASTECIHAWMGVAIALALQTPETKKPAFAGLIILSRGAQERTRT